MQARRAKCVTRAEENGTVVISVPSSNMKLVFQVQHSNSEHSWPADSVLSGLWHPVPPQPLNRKILVIPIIYRVRTSCLKS